MNPALGVEERPNEAIAWLRTPPPQAPGRVLDPLHGNALPARRRRRDGLLSELRRIASVRQRRCLLLPQALRGARPDRAAGDALRGTPRAQADPRADAAPAPNLVRADRRRDAARHRRHGQRRDAVAGGRPAPIPALRAAQGLIGAVRGAAAGRPTPFGAHGRRALQAAAARRGGGLRAAPEAARHGDRDGGVLLDRRTARGGRHAAAQPRPDCRHAGRPRAVARDRRALPTRATHLVPRPVLRCRRQRLPCRR